MDETALRILAAQVIEGLQLEELAPEELDPDRPFFGGGLGLDSIDALELAAIVERHYGVQIASGTEGRGAFANLRTLGDYIVRHRRTAV
jgi:acyl carrier protein